MTTSIEILRDVLRPVTPWKNGGGLTREVAAFPANASMADFDWRISIADVAAAGPFSRFENVDRKGGSCLFHACSAQWCRRPCSRYCAVEIAA